MFTMTNRRVVRITGIIIAIIIVIACVLAIGRLRQPIKEYPLDVSSEAGIVCTTPLLPANAAAIVQKRYAAAAGLLWFADRTGNKIGRMNSTGVVVEYTIPTANSYPVGCAFGPMDGLLYFAEENSFKVAAFDPFSLTFTEWPVPLPNRGLAGVVFDAKNGLDVLVALDSAIQRMQADGTFLSPIQLQPGRYPHGPVQCGGNVWFAENTANRVARLAPDGTVTEIILPQPHSQPFAMVCGKDGVYFTEFNANKVGKIDMATLVITQWDVPTAKSNPMGLAIGDDGNVYFAESRANKIARMPVGGGTIKEYRVPTRHALPNKVTPCFLSAICFSERGAPKLGVLRLRSKITTGAGD